jgi:hypothetical protein
MQHSETIVQQKQLTKLESIPFAFFSEKYQSPAGSVLLTSGQDLLFRCQSLAGA